MTNHDPSAERLSTAAIISYVILAIFGLTVGGVFGLILLHLKVEPEMLTILGTVIGAVAAAQLSVSNFWMGSSSGAKTSNAALAQLAGAGAPPPAAPGSGTPAEVVPGEGTPVEPRP